MKQQNNHGSIQKVCHLHNETFHSVHLGHILPTLLYHLPCIIKSIKLWDEKNEDLLYIWLLPHFKLYQRK